MASNTDLTLLVTQLIFGAEHYIDLKTEWKGGDDWGVPLEDMGAMVHNHLRLRCLLPSPYPDDITPASDPTYDLREIVGKLQRFGWQVRVADAGGRITTSLVIDDKHVIFREKLNEPAPFHYSTDAHDVAHYKGQFENYWKTSIAADRVATIYRSLIVKRPENIQPLIVFSQSTWTRLINKLARNPNELFQLGSRSFEELVAELLSRDGMEVILTPASRDGGRDILALAHTPVGTQLYLAECKRYARQNTVGVGVVRSLYGVVTQENATAGLIVTTSEFTTDALQFVKPVRYKMGLKDFDGLVAWLRQHVK